MTKQAGFKRRVRARMAKTGESYATARSRLLAEHPGRAPDDSPLDWMPEALHLSNGDATDVPGTGLARRVMAPKPSSTSPARHSSPRLGTLRDDNLRRVWRLALDGGLPFGE